MTTSGTTSFNPPIADLIIECFSRLQIRGPALQVEHIVEARRSANLILADWSANRSVNLWAVDLLQIPLVTGITRYLLPPDTIQALDVYIRTYTSNTEITTLGAVLTPLVMGSGVPVVSALGDPTVLNPGSGALSATRGSQYMEMVWQSHGLFAGDPIILSGIVSIGGIALSGFLSVNRVIDTNTIEFISPIPAIETQSLQGATPLLQTTDTSTTVLVIYPNHGLSLGDTFTVWDDTTVGGITLSGEYTVDAITNDYQFAITAASAATSNACGFIDDGQINVTSQAPGNDYTDLVMYGVSRSEYAAIPQKQSQGRPTTFWFERQFQPSITVWEVPQSGISYNLAIYRMRQLEDANPLSGQTLDMPNRFLPAFTAELTAMLAEKFHPEMLPAKSALAVQAWTRAAQEDRELVPWFITPGLSGYFR